MIHFILAVYCPSGKGLFALVCLLLINTTNVPAQEINLDKSKKLSQYVLQSGSTEEGMASEYTYEMIQTDDGYIWIATYAGLHRFDGKDFTIYNGVNSNIPSPNVSCVEKGINGEVWIGSLHGIAFFKAGTFSTPKALEPVRNMRIKKMLMTRDGVLWFSTQSNRLFSYEGEKLVEFTVEFDLYESTVLTMIEAENGDVYFGTNDARLFAYSKSGSYKEIPIGTIARRVNTLFFADNLLYIGTGTGLFAWDGLQISKCRFISDRAITSLIVDKNEVFWVGTTKGLFRWDSENSILDSLTEESGMPNNFVRDMLFDMDGNLWVATYRKGIFFLYDGSITSFTKEDGLETNIISAVTEIGENMYLMGNENGRLNLLKDDEISLWESPLSLPSARLKHMFTDSKGRVWVSTYRGLFVLDGKDSRSFTVEQGFPDNYIRVSHEDTQGTIWVGTKHAGLIRFKSLDRWDQITMEDGLSSNYIMSIESDQGRGLVIGTVNGLNIIDPNEEITSITTNNGLPSNFMFCTLSTPNFIWIASNDGLTGYNEQKIVNFNSENGLEADIVYNILEDKEGNFWMPSENSIVRINIDDLESAALNSTFLFDVKKYDKSYGMKSTNFLGAVHSYHDSKGNFWIPTQGGIVKLNPDQVSDPSFVPNMIIENIVADNNPLDLGQEVLVPAGTDRLLIDFTAISYVQTGKLQFRYKLDPFDEEWVEASPERNGIYTNLPPKDYTFMLQTGLDKTFTSEIMVQKIRIEAEWWQTLWAKTLLVLFIVGLAILIFWLRLRALTARNAWLERTVSKRTEELERQKQDLKDAIERLKNAQEQMVQSDKMASLGTLSAGVAHEINNPLNFIQGGVEGLEFSLKKNNELNSKGYAELIDAIKEGINRTSKIVDSLNEFSHSTDDRYEPCNVHHLIENCITMIRYRLKEGVELIKEFTSEELRIMGNNGEIHQAFLNIVNNAIQAIEDKGYIKIKTWAEDEQVVVEVIDSGQGIKAENLPKITEPFFSTKDPGKGTGLGLSITYSIIADHKGNLTYSSIWGKGTTARVSLPSI